MHLRVHVVNGSRPASSFYPFLVQPVGIVYTGAGGRDMKTGEQIEDQSLNHTNIKPH